MKNLFSIFDKQYKCTTRKTAKKEKIIYIYWMLGHVRSAQAQVFPAAATYLVK